MIKHSRQPYSMNKSILCVSALLSVLFIPNCTTPIYGTGQEPKPTDKVWALETKTAPTKPDTGCNGEILMILDTTSVSGVERLKSCEPEPLSGFKVLIKKQFDTSVPDPLVVYGHGVKPGNGPIWMLSTGFNPNLASSAIKSDVVIWVNRVIVKQAKEVGTAPNGETCYELTLKKPSQPLSHRLLKEASKSQSLKH